MLSERAGLRSPARRWAARTRSEHEASVKGVKILTDEKFASIPAMIEQGTSKEVIAAMWGVTISTLQVQCSRRGISLSKGGHLLPR